MTPMSYFFTSPFWKFGGPGSGPPEGNQNAAKGGGIEPGKDTDHVVMTGHSIKKETEKALLVSHPKHGEAWVPKSQVEQKEDGSLEMKKWVADKFKPATHTFEPEYPVKETASGKAYQMRVSVDRMDGEPEDVTVFLPKSQVTYKEGKMTAPHWLLDAKEAEIRDPSSGRSGLLW